jgi:hypothetical protein
VCRIRNSLYLGLGFGRISTSDADGDKAAALLIDAVALFASDDGMADPGIGTPPNFGALISWVDVSGIGEPPNNQESYATILCRTRCSLEWLVIAAASAAAILLSR